MVLRAHMLDAVKKLKIETAILVSFSFNLFLAASQSDFKITLLFICIAFQKQKFRYCEKATKFKEKI